jgi:ATP-dependent Clp protease ATP-binding subunit ClpA
MMQGRTVNFANCVIIMTSNLGSEYLLQAAATRPASPAEAASIGQLGQDAAKELVMAQVGVAKKLHYEIVVESLHTPSRSPKVIATP